ncbi:MAG: TauD/TfdA dioxygenase family protein [Candidatus Eiseniibacteriota bacterium]
MISVRPLSPALGAEIGGVDLARPLDDAAFRRILDAFHAHSVILFRDQHLSEAQHIAFSRRFGPLEIHVAKQYLLPGHPEIVVLSNRVDADGRPEGIEDAGRYWHSDLSYMRRPSLGSLLYALEVPDEGGDTLFASMHAAHDALPAGLKGRIEGLKAVHRYGDRWRKDAAQGRARASLSDAERQATPDAIHPVVRVHPGNGRPALYVNEGFTVGIVGMAEDEGRALLGELFAFSTRPEFTWRHRWRPGDLLFWDNRSVVHSATDYDPRTIRHLHRTTVAGSETT